jgi:general secretion pathway protein A
MYLDLYGVKQAPFNITADPNFFFDSLSHREALAALNYGVNQKKGLVLITGEVGTGKTTLCKTFLDTLSQNVRTSVIFHQPHFSEVQLLRAIVEDFGVEDAKASRFDIVKRLNSFLVDVSLCGGNAVLIVDEAQNLTHRQLEQVRLLSNLEIASEKLLQIVLLGQPELSRKLAKYEARQIRQRIFVKHHLSPLRQEEVRRYIEFRLHKAGISDITILPAGYQLIWEFSGGIPRLVNMLCDRALLYGFSREKRVFGPDIFIPCIEELK